VAESRDGRWAQIRARKLAEPAAQERYDRTRRTVAAIRETLMRVDDERARAGLTKAELARRLGANPATMRRLLSSGQRNPTLKTVLEICDVLGLEVTVAPRRGKAAGSRSPSRARAAS
jgi:DNA-binding XRE family transcriptional regulator